MGEKYDRIIIGAGLYGLYAARFCGKRDVYKRQLLALSFVWSTEVGIVTMLSYAVYGWSWYAMDGEKFSTDKVAVF